MINDTGIRVKILKIRYYYISEYLSYEFGNLGMKYTDAFEISFLILRL